MKKKDLEKKTTNVFEDLGLQNPEERLVKAELAIQINFLIKQKGLNQKEAAEILETDQAKISALHKGKLAGFSLERLFRFLNILGQSISIKVSNKTKAKKTPDLSVNLQKIKPLIKPKEIKNRPSLMAKKK